MIPRVLDATRPRVRTRVKEMCNSFIGTEPACVKEANYAVSCVCSEPGGAERAAGAKANTIAASGG